MIFTELTEVLDPEPHDAALNMAIDEVLLRGAATPLLRGYRWARAALSFGYFGDFRAAAARWPGRDLVRRWTGGGEVPHGTDCTYTLIVPRTDPFCRRGAAESYCVIHEQVAALLGAAVAAAAAPKLSDACFENAVRFDVLSGERKIAGAAQRRTAHGLLHQGSIDDPGLDGSFVTRLAERLAEQVHNRPLASDELAAAQELAREKYATEAWLRRFEGRGEAGTADGS